MSLNNRKGFGAGIPSPFFRAISFLNCRKTGFKEIFDYRHQQCIM